MDVALETGLPVANGILTTDTEAQALERKDKGAEAGARGDRDGAPAAGAERKMALKTARGSSRRRAREIALQALYAWRMQGGDALAQAQGLEGWDRCDQGFAKELLVSVPAKIEFLEQKISPHLDRSLASLSPVERAILLIAAYELAERPETPFKVVLNEAIELGKSFGGTDGHKFINGVLEKLAVELRAEEIARVRQAV
jgi:N utilization substance protein B